MTSHEELARRLRAACNGGAVPPLHDGLDPTEVDSTYDIMTSAALRTAEKIAGRIAPVGPWFVTADEVDLAAGLPLRTIVNGRVMQDGNSANMIFGVARLLSYVSEFMTLEPGDIITTGTPAGVGLGQRPDPIFLGEGDVVELDGGPLGTQRQRIVAPC